jgi:hypothetical protein
LLDEDPHDLLRAELHKRCNGASHGLVVEYDAAALDASQPQAVAELHDALLALWVVRPTPLHFRAVAHVRKEGAGYVTRHLETHNPFLVSQECQKAEHEPADFPAAASLHLALSTLPPGKTVHTATRALLRALTEHDWALRFLLMWIGIEALFGTDAEVTYRLSQRVGLFLGTSAAGVQALFKPTKRNYG